MASREIDPFEIGRRSLAIPFREFPIWFVCALWPFAWAIGMALAKRHAIVIPPLLRDPAGWIVDTIFDWCWMTALCRSTTLQVLTFPAKRGFWLFLVLNLGLSAAFAAFSLLLGILIGAALEGGVFFIDVSGSLVQLVGVIAAPLLFFAGLWIGLRLMIWPAHCVATGRLMAPRTIWRGMENHSFDVLIISVITTGPSLLLTLGAFILERTTDLFDAVSPAVFSNVGTVIGIYSTGAFDAVMLIAYYAIFAPKEL